MQAASSKQQINWSARDQGFDASREFTLLSQKNCPLRKNNLLFKL